MGKNIKSKDSEIAESVDNFFEIPEFSDDQFRFFVNLLKKNSGIELGKGKENLVSARLGRIFRSKNLRDWDEYINILTSNDNEIQPFVNALTTNKTEFFREKEHFDYVAEKVKNFREGEITSIWVVACSTGEEAYTLAMLLDELNQASGGMRPYRILATDIDTGALDTARKGIYSMAKAGKELPDDYKRKYFLKGKGIFGTKIKIIPKIQENIKFRFLNMCDQSISLPINFDFIFIRNVLIYFDNRTIQQVVRMLLSHLKKGGTLVSGMCESLAEKSLPIQRVGPSIYVHKKSNYPISKEDKCHLPGNIKSNSYSQISSKKGSKIKVLIVDDSKVIQKVLAAVISEHPEFEVFGIANDPLEAEKLMSKIEPDIITLDVNMPRMSGIEYLEKLIPKRRLPVIMISEASTEDREISFRSVELGAIDFIEKPQMNDLSNFSTVLKEKLYTAFSSKRNLIKKSRFSSQEPTFANIPESCNRIVAIGTSTGGTVALANILTKLPRSFPPILIVQHIPEYFSSLLAKRLNEISPLEVKEAESMDQLRWGQVLIAPGGKHLSIGKRNGEFVAVVEQGEAVNRHRPSVDVLFNSMANQCGPQAVGIILTGMGKDGALGLLNMRKAGAYTLAQDEQSSVVFGMPKEAIKLDAACEVVSLEDCCETLCTYLSKRSKVA